VSHGFDGTDVLGDLTLSVASGETLAVIGPSGTGKTTLLRLLSLYYRPDAGTVRIDGTDAWSLSERERLSARRRIGMVFQEPNLFDATVRRIVGYCLPVSRYFRARLALGIPRPRGRGTVQAGDDGREPRVLP
jgi:tungstate transport system ATP-binding protein